MTARTSTPTGAPTWADVTTSDQPRAIAFYEALFGWEHEAPYAELGGYANFLRGGIRIAGCMPAMPGGRPDLWGVQLATEDAEKTAELVRTAGGQVVAPPMDVMDLGRLAVCTDPGGAAFGIWQAGTHPGFRTLAEPGAPSWFELHTKDYERVLDFYREALGWTTETLADEPGFRYSALVVDGQQLAGVMDSTGWPADDDGWAVYWHCDDVAATLARVEELGGKAVRGPDVTPYGVLAVATDPVGAVLKLQEPPR